MKTFLTGTTVVDPFWETIRDQIFGKPSAEIRECQKPKPVLVHTGEVNVVYIMMKLVIALLNL